MSAIGDYVHYSKMGYLNFGTEKANGREINKKNNEGENKGKTVLETYYTNTKMRNEMLRNTAMSEEEQQRLANMIAGLMAPAKLEDEAQKKRADELWEDLKKFLIEEFHSDDLADRIVRGAGNVLHRGSKIGVSTIETKEGKQTFLGTVFKRLNGLQDAINGLLDGQKSKNKLKSNLDQIYKELLKILDLEDEFIESTGYNFTAMKEKAEAKGISFSQGFRKGSTKERGMMINNKKGSVVDLVNQCISTFKDLANLEKGTLLETTISLASILSGSIAVDNVQKYISEAVVGKNTKENIYATAQFSKEVDWKTVLGKDYTEPINEIMEIKTKATQDKVDTVLTWKDNKSNQTKLVGISAKNLSVHTNATIKLVEGVSLLNLLQDFENIDFVNHYLNIAALHDKEQQPLQGSRYSDLINKAHLAIKANILIKALQGHKLDSSVPELLVLNDNNTGAVYVFDIYNLIYQVLSSIGGSEPFGNSVIEENSYGEDITKIHFINSWVDNDSRDYGPRISNLLADVHSNKMRVGLKITSDLLNLAMKN